jgi:hypothetical protein
MVGRGRFGHSVVCASYPNNIEHDAGSKLQRGRDAAVRLFEGKLVGDKKITLDDHPGLEFLIRMKNGDYYRSRIFTVGTRLYQVTLVATKEDATSKQSDAFFESFRLIEAED